ncbi:MAG: class I SAM-dependent RNA methyltransferase [Verrucomicrobia bacterium]|nr:class I SAM-dependent RNA methyltransferase [Verrucomicrobiota bacterium]
MNNAREQLSTEFSTHLSCSYFPTCSGCEIQGKLTPPPVWEELLHFFSRAAPHLTPTFSMREVTRWRTRSKLAVRGTLARPEIGLFKKDSHEVIPIPQCPLHHAAIERAYALVQKCGLEPYQEKSGRGTLRYVQFAVERKSRRVQLTLVLNRPAADPRTLSLVKQLYMEGGFHSIYLNFQPEKTNRIFGEKWLLCEGKPYIEETLGVATCYFHPACFAQSHLSLFEEVLSDIRRWVPQGKRILELYAGVGAIGLNLASQSKEVHCVEIHPHAAECFALSRLKLAAADQQKITHQTATAEAVREFKEVVVVDPPRKGIDPTLLEALSDSSVEQLLYLSCGPLSMQRDGEFLLKKGWKLVGAKGYLFFPGTNHVETLTNWKRSG